MKYSQLILMACFSISLAACGGGGGGGSSPDLEEPTVPEVLPPQIPITNQKTGGLWYGKVTYSDGVDVDSVAFTTETGELRSFQWNGEHTIGSMTADGNTFEANALAILEDDITPINVAGTIEERSSFKGSTFYNSAELSQFDFTFDNQYFIGSSLESLEGIYTYVDGSYTETVNVYDNGTIYATDSNGCVTGGNIYIIDPVFNMYKIFYTKQNCGSLDGDYEGLAASIDWQTDGFRQTITLTANSNSNIVARILTKT